MLHILLDPLAFEFMRNALMIAVMIGVLCAIAGTYLIVQRMSLLGEVVAHSVFPGLAIAFFQGVDIFLGAFISGLFSTFVVSAIRSQSKIKVDAAMAIVFSSFLALGIVLITLLASKIDLDSFLFGNILSTTNADVWRTAVITVFILLLVKLFYKELLFYTFDPQAAQVGGLPVGWLNFGLMFVLTLTIISSMKTVGAMLVIALLVTPGTTAYLLVKQLHLMMMVGAAIGIFASTSGMYISYYFNLPSGPAIVLVSSALFVITLLFSPSDGIITRWHPRNLSK